MKDFLIPYTQDQIKEAIKKSPILKRKKFLYDTSDSFVTATNGLVCFHISKHLVTIAVYGSKYDCGPSIVWDSPSNSLEESIEIIENFYQIKKS